MADLSSGILVAWQVAAQEAGGTGYAAIGRGHLFLGITSVEGWMKNELISVKPLAELGKIREEVGALSSLFRRQGIDPITAQERMRQVIGTRNDVIGADALMHRSTACRAVFSRARKLASSLSSQPHLLHLWSALLDQPGMELAQALARCGRDLQILQTEAKEALASFKIPVVDADGDKQLPSPAFSILEQFGTDLTRLAREGKIERIVGRNRELLQLARTLSRKSKNNPILLGDPGVGKTAIVRSLAQRISDGKVPPSLRGARLIELNLGTLVAGTKYRGEFEERLSALLEEVKKDPNLVLFLDEIHTLVKAGGPEGGLDAANILKPILAGQGIRLIGSTTHAEYTRYLEKDAALVRRFQPIVVEAPSQDDTYAILVELKQEYETHHQVHIANSALKAAVTLAHQYLPERNFPDKALDLIDEACARAKIASARFRPGDEALSDAQQATIDEEMVADVVSEWTGIPVSRLNAEGRERLKGMDTYLSERILGQETAIEAVTRLVMISRAGFMESNRPSGVLLFIGPSGTGKTALCQVLAEFLFGSVDALISLDMSDFQEHGALNRLIGAPPGYIGHDEEGQLTGRLRRKPHSIVVIEGIDKAPPEAMDLFIQLFGDGRLKDSKGRIIDCRHAIFVLTSSHEIKGARSGRPIGFGEPVLPGHEVLADQSKVVPGLSGIFGSQFLSRIDEVVQFRLLGHEDLVKIALRLLVPIIEAMKNKGITLVVNPDFIEKIAASGANEGRGAHPMARTLDQLLKGPLSKLILNEQLSAGNQIEVQFSGGKVALKVIK